MRPVPVPVPRMACTALLWLSACVSTQEVPTTPDGTGTPQTFGEPISSQQVLQGIQIGEGGDGLPCAEVLEPVADPDTTGWFDDLQGTWPQLPFAIDGRSGEATLTLLLDSTWLLSYTELSTGSTSYDCAAEPPRIVGALWFGFDDGRSLGELPVFASALDGPSTRFEGEAPETELGGMLDGTYWLRGEVLADALVVDVYDQAFYEPPIGRIGE